MNRSGLMRLSLGALIAYAEGLAAKLNTQVDALEGENDRRTRGRRRLSRTPAARWARVRRRMKAVRATQAQLRDAQDVIIKKESAAREQDALLFSARASVASAAELSRPKRQPAAVELETSPDPRFHAWVPLNDELIADPKALALYVRAKVPAKMLEVTDGLLAAAEKALALHEDAGCSCGGCADLRSAVVKAGGR